MAAPQFSCNLNSLIVASACFGPNCLGPYDRDAIDVFVRLTALAKNGGTDYRANQHQLMADSALWAKQSCATLGAVSSYVDLLGANDNGAGLGTNLKAISKSALQCYDSGCIGKDQLRGMKEFLKCSLYALNLPD